MKPITTFLLLLFYLVTNAQEWVRQNPFGNLSQMYDISFDGQYGLAVGADATIFTTSNYGGTWTQQKPSILARDITAALVVPGRMGQVMLAAGDSIMMTSRDGGLTWKASYVEVPNIFKIQYLPGNVILALGKDFGIYSIDDGVLWQPFNFPAFGVTAGHFVSVLEGWVALGEPDNVQVWYTSNGGFNWSLRDNQVFNLVTGIEMLNDSVGFLASRNYVYKTFNGGDLWYKLHNVPVDYIRDLFVTNEDNLWTALDDGSIHFSNTGGSTWERIDPGIIHTNRTLGIWAEPSGKIWIVGKYLSILHSADYGQTWVDQLPAAKYTLFEPSFYNAFVGMVGGSEGSVMRTKNSGATWLSSTQPVYQNFTGTDMVDENTVIVGSTTGKVLISSDQGLTWKEIGTDLGKITDLHAFSADEIVITNEAGDIYKTSNGGSSWELTYDGALVLNALMFYNENLGWATGISGRVLKTLDGGDSWSIAFNDGENTFTDIFFTTPDAGWVTSSNYVDSIWHTSDGGTTWSGIALPDTSYWYGVAFMDQDTGWIVGGTNGEGIILRTNDKGQSWFLDHVSPDAFQGIYVIPNSETVWAVGFGGNIMKFSSCASPPQLLDLRGTLEPCVGDTVNFVVEFNEVDVFEWLIPSDWTVVGNMNTASIYLIAGSTPGMVSIQGHSACGDTTEAITVNVFPVAVPDIIIEEQNGTLISNLTSGAFQWYLDSIAIPGANEPNFTPTTNGTYYLHYTTFATGCEGYSNSLVFVITSTAKVEDDGLLIYPNPAIESLTLQYKDGRTVSSGMNVSMTDMEGRQVFNTVTKNNRIDLPLLPGGIYTLQLQTEEGVITKKVMIREN